MGRFPSLRSLAAVAVLVPAGGALAAEITHVVSSGDVDKPFGLDFTVRYDRIQHTAKITQEGLGTGGYVQDLPELNWSRTANVLVPRVAIGLYQDLELHVEAPYVLSDDVKWTDASGAELVDRATAPSTRTARPAPAPCPIFPVGRGHHRLPRRRLGDLKVGLAWGIFSEKRDDTKPTWVVGLDVTLPTATLYDPVRGAAALRPPGNPAPAGAPEDLEVRRLQTALSKQYGAVDPYVKIHVTLPRRSGTTYSNCDHASVLAANAPPQPQMTSIAPANCLDSALEGRTPSPSRRRSTA